MRISILLFKRTDCIPSGNFGTGECDTTSSSAGVARRNVHIETNDMQSSIYRLVKHKK